MHPTLAAAQSTKGYPMIRIEVTRCSLGTPAKADKITYFPNNPVGIQQAIDAVKLLHPDWERINLQLDRG